MQTELITYRLCLQYSQKNKELALLSGSFWQDSSSSIKSNQLYNKQSYAATAKWLSRLATADLVA